MQWLWDQYFANRFSDSPNVLVSRTTRGNKIIVKPPPGVGLKVEPYKLKPGTTFNAADHLVCHSWNGTTEGTEDIFIAKPPDLRSSLTTEILRGVTIDYSAYNNIAQTRVATQRGTATTETQYITKPYIAGDVIWAVTAWSGVTFTNTAVTPSRTETVTLLDLNIAGRSFAAY